MTPLTALHVDQVSDFKRLTFDLGASIRVDVVGGPQEVELHFFAGDTRIAVARALFEDAIDSFTAERSRGAVAIKATLPPLPSETKARRWALRLMPIADDALVQIVEVSSIATGHWSWEFAGHTLHVQKQVGFHTATPDGEHFGFGGFTQHGQIANLKDWFFLERDEQCSGLLSLRPGTWTHPSFTVGQATGDGESLKLVVPHGAPRVRRSFLLAHASSEQVLARKKTGQQGFEPLGGYAHWPAKQIARLGFARPERVTRYVNDVSASVITRPTKFAWGDDHALSRAFDRAQGEPQLADNPFWVGDFARAKAWMLTTLYQFDGALKDGGYLHPLGNPVAGRVLGPAAALFHMLDYMGHLSDAERLDAAQLLATTAELLSRRDFYPHDFATESPEFPYTDASLYRGMLNQNFNTDRYVFVGLAGCVLPQHPHAARWRRHAIEQFQLQMKAYVYPGGAWEESHTYANHVKMTLLPLVAALQHAPEAVDLMKNESFMATCRFFIPLLATPDANANGRRHVPAIGDHNLGKHDDFGCIFGWLSTLCPERRDEFLWAWKAQGAPVGENHSMQMTTFSPLLLPPRNALTPPSPPMPMSQSLPGYGAFARRRMDTREESLLVVRCGPAWGHYHNDQGSFWWWVRNRLICCDAGLGAGSLKFAHHGHNVPGYVGYEPRQWLDRHPYEVDQCEQTEDGSAVIRCQVPTVQWMHASERPDRIPPYQRPHVTRTFKWRGLDELRITDEMVRSPDGLATFTLHAVSRDVRFTGPTEITFDLDPGTLTLKLPAEPKDVKIYRIDGTCGVTCTYAEGTLVHDLQIDQGRA